MFPTDISASTGLPHLQGNHRLQHPVRVPAIEEVRHLPLNERPVVDALLRPALEQRLTPCIRSRLLPRTTHASRRHNDLTRRQMRRETPARTTELLDDVPNSHRTRTSANRNQPPPFFRPESQLSSPRGSLKPAARPPPTHRAFLIRAPTALPKMKPIRELEVAPSFAAASASARRGGS